MIKKYLCNSCGKENEIETFPLINVEAYPELKNLLRSGVLFAWQCKHCKKNHLANYQTIYHDPAKKLLIWLLPKQEADENIITKLEQALSQQFTDNYNFRRVSTLGELLEKIKIFDLDLDDRIIEICKYITALEMPEKLANTEIRFYELQGADHDLIFSFAENETMKMLNLGFNVYEDARGIFQRNSNMQENSSVFPVIDSNWIKKFFA